MSNVVSHGIKIELDKKQYNAIVAAMNNINGRSAEFVISHGSNTAAKKIQKLLSNQVKRRLSGTMGSRRLRKIKYHKRKCTECWSRNSFQIRAARYYKIQIPSGINPDDICKESAIQAS